MYSKKICLMVLILTLLMVPSFSFAAEKSLYKPNTIISFDPNPGEIILKENQNYDNPVTGEYFRWENINSRNALYGNTVAKDFSFEISVSVISSSFDIDSKKINVESNAKLLDLNIQDYINGTYDIEIHNGWSTKTKNFKTGNDSKVYRDLNPKKTCKICIKNDGSWDRYHCVLSGNGTIYNVK